MANCPKCEAPIKWVKLLALNKQTEIECRNCHVKLRMNQKRATEIGGLFFILAIISFIPDLNLEISYLWIFILVPPFTVVWVKFIKLDEVTDPVFIPTTEEKDKLQNYIARRRKTDLKLIFIIVAGMTIWLIDAFVLNSQINEFVLIIIIFVMFVCVASLYFTCCPFCKKITPSIHNAKTCRYCKKSIN